MTGSNQTLAGTGAGSLTAIGKYLIDNGFHEFFHVVYVAAVGAAVGFIVTELLKYLKRKLTKTNKNE